MSKLNLVLVFGGESAEHEVSISSASNVYQALDKQRYAIALVYIDRQGRWWRVESFDDLERPSNELAPHLGSDELIDSNGESLRPQVILPILHGPNGEDGSVQGLSQLLHVPIVGCHVLGSAVCMDKDGAKRLLQQAGVPVVDYLVHHATDPALDFAQATKQLGEVLFVKPASLGSSVGVSKVNSPQEFGQALAQAHKHDRKVLIERAVQAREIECSVLGNGNPQASVLGEITPDEEFYSYEAKYATTSKSRISIPADVPETAASSIRELAVQAYRALECRGLARVDFFLADDGTIYVNELNTLPGFTNISMYPKLWQASGLSYSALLDKLVDLALEQ